MLTPHLTDGQFSGYRAQTLTPGDLLRVADHLAACEDCRRQLLAGYGAETAIIQLRQVADYFHTHEPHSPVAPLVERAARWGEMNLDSWLTEVVPDETVLTTLKTLLDFREETR